MTWIASHVELARHPKLNKLRRALGKDRETVIGYLHLFWWWVMEFAPDGNISRYEPEEILDGMMVDYDAKKFVECLVSAKFVDKTGENGEVLVIHDWKDYGGKLLEAKEGNRIRAATSRQKRSARPAALPPTAHQEEPEWEAVKDDRQSGMNSVNHANDTVRGSRGNGRR